METNKKSEETPQKGISEKQVSVSEWDAIILRDLRRQQPNYNESVDKLGVVLEDLVNMLDLDGSGIDVYILQYVVDARQSLRAILQLLEDSGPKEVSSDSQKWILFVYSRNIQHFMDVYAKQVVKLLIYDFLFFKTA